MLSKITIVVAMWILYIVIYNLLYPIVTVESVLNQFTNSSTSYGMLHIQQVAFKISFIIPMLISLYMFKQEIKNIYYKILESLS